MQNLVILPKLAKVNNMLNKAFSSISEAESYLGYLEERIAQNFDLELINERNQLLAEIYTMERGGCKLDLRKENERLRSVAHVTKTIPKKGKPCKAFGKTYATTKELAADYGLSVQALNYHRRKTNDLESAIRSALEARERKK